MVDRFKDALGFQSKQSKQIPYNNRTEATIAQPPGLKHLRSLTESKLFFKHQLISFSTTTSHLIYFLLSLSLVLLPNPTKWMPQLFLTLR
jgi:hypothetical protein